MTNPCYKCTDREPGCHSVCEKYIEWKAEYQQHKKAIDDIRHIENEFMGMVHNRSERIEREIRNGRKK